MDKTSFGFPFEIIDGKVAYLTGDDNIKAKIEQILFTSPGERVNLPEFGCGLMNLVFDPNNDVLAATTEFNIRKALERWMRGEIIVESVNVSSQEETILIEIIYIRKDTLERDKVNLNL